MPVKEQPARIAEYGAGIRTDRGIRYEAGLAPQLPENSLIPGGC